jgi:integrase
LRADAYGSMGAAWGKWCALFARKLVPDRTRVAHSWRHTVAAKLRQAGVREDVMDQLLGWTSAKMTRRYGSGFGMGTLKESVERIRYDVVWGGSVPARESSPPDSPP